MDEYDDDDDQVHTLTYSCIMAPSRCTKRFLNISDTIIAVGVVTPLVVTYWYGTWTFMDNNAEYFPALPTLVLGLLWNLLLVLLRHHLHEQVKTKKQMEKTWIQRCTRYFIIKLFIYTFSISCIMVFRAIFVLCTPYGEWIIMIICDIKENIPEKSIIFVFIFARWRFHSGHNWIGAFSCTIALLEIHTEYHRPTDGHCNGLQRSFLPFSNSI